MYRCGVGVVIEKGCKIGDKTYLGNYCVLKKRTIIGKNTVVGHLTVFEGDCKIGDDCLIHAQCHITAGTIIEDKVFIAPGYIGANDRRMVHLRRDKVSFNKKAPIIRYGARLAIGVLVLPGVEIRRESFIGAGSVVTRNTVPYGKYIGAPARFMGFVPEEERL